MSLRLRLLVVSIALVGAGLTAAALVTYSTLSSFLQSRTEAQLDAAAANVRHVISDLPAGTTVDRDGLAQAAPGIWVQLRPADGAPAMEVQGYSWTAKPTSPDLPDQLPQLTGGGYLGPSARFTTGAAQPGGSPFRVLVATTNQGGTLVLGASQQETERTLKRLVMVELIAGTLILGVSAISGLWLMRLGLRPLARMEAAAENIAEDNIAERLPGATTNTEVGRLARVLNTMLARLEAAFTERRESEERLRKSEERLRRFAADASHELRTPIASVRAYTELYRRRGGDRNDAGYVIGQIEQESVRLSKLVDDLLLLARLDDGRPLAQEPVDLGALADEAVKSARVLDPDRAIELMVVGSVEVTGDRDRLRQVVDNLLSNVLTHTPAGTPALVTVASDGRDAVLEVADRGFGLPEAEHERVFERFYRADPSRARISGGAGLGLSILNAIVVAHGGRAAVEPRVGGGALFRITLPALVDPVMSQRVHSSGVHDVLTQQGGRHDRQGDPPAFEPSHS
jgi:two-component system, OmpR family, sensor kinase